MTTSRVIALALLLWLAPSPAGASDTLHLDANESPPIWSASMPNGGMGGEIIQAIAKAADLHIVIDFKPLQRMIEDDTNNDLGNPYFFLHNQSFAAIIPIAIYHVSIFSYTAPSQTPRSLDIHTLQDLKGYKVGILKGTLVNRSAFERAGVVFEESYSPQSMFKKLAKGRIDLVIETHVVGRQIIRDLFPDAQEHFHSTTLPHSASPIAIHIATQQPHAHRIADALKRGLQQIRASGEYGKIIQHYDSDPVSIDYNEELDRFSHLYHMQGL